MNTHAGVAVRLHEAMLALQDACGRHAAEDGRAVAASNQAVTDAEAQARAAADRAITSAAELGNAAALGVRLRQLASELGAEPVRAASRAVAPARLADTVAEWDRLAPRAVRTMANHREQLLAWEAKTFKRSSSRPRLDETIWADLDRLDVLHRAAPQQRTELIRQKRDAAAEQQAEHRRQLLDKHRVAEQRLTNDVVSLLEEIDRQIASGPGPHLAGLPLSDATWLDPGVATEVQRLIRVGSIQPALPASISLPEVPALLPFPFVNGIAVGASVDQRSAAIGLLKSIVVRVFAAVPPGALHVKAIDPVALGQSVAELRHLSEFDGQLLDEKTWTTERDIETVLDELAVHLELVISSYLRGQFDTIDDYNQHAGEVAQPYRLLTVFDYPNGFTDRATQQLLSLIENGPRCGVFTVLHHGSPVTDDNRYGAVSLERLVHGMQQISLTGTGGSGAPQRAYAMSDGNTYQGVVTDVRSSGIAVTLDNGSVGFVNSSDLTSRGIATPAVGDHIRLRYERADDGTNVSRLVAVAAPTQTGARTAGRMLAVPGGTPLNVVLDAEPEITFSSAGEALTPAASLLLRIGQAVQQVRSRPPVVTLGSLLPVLARSRSGVLPDYAPGAAPLTADASTWWHATTARTAIAPIGRSGAQGVTSMFFSSTEVAGGAIMVGLPRSGKTTCLHAMITTMAMLYPPDELELYLIDAKHGVEFKAYERLPHARMVSIHSEREFSLAVLQSLQSEIRRRAELMKAHGSGTANITEYRLATGTTLPRIVIVIDEFHELFEEADAVGHAAFAAFSDIVRMGPFSGVHVVVASQTLSNMPAMDRPTLTLLPQRVAFMCNEYDADIVMGENRAVRSLHSTGAGLFNPARGDEARNQPFQGIYIEPAQRADIVDQLGAMAISRGWTRQPRVFDGHSTVDRPQHLPEPTQARGRLTIPIGEPFTLEDADYIRLPRSRGANIMVLGDSDAEESTDRTARGVVHSILLAARSQAEVTVVDFLADEEHNDGLSVLDVATATSAHYVRSRALATVLEPMCQQVRKRLESEDYRSASIVLTLVGLQRALDLRPVDPYADDDDAPDPSAMLKELLSLGPEVGIHVVVVADSARSVELRLGRDLMAEITTRVASSAAESADLSVVSGAYGETAPLGFGQVLIGDHITGKSRRVRGYTILHNQSS